MSKHDDSLDTEEHSTSNDYNWIADFVYGGIDGAVTTFAVVAGVEGASLAVPIILILGFANLFGDGFSMSIGKYLSDKANLEQYEKIRQIEFRHLTEKTDHEIGEVRDIMKTYGFKGKDLERAVEVITSNPEGWVDLMMRNEFNMTNENVNPMRGALITFFSFITVGFIPLIGYTFKAFVSFSDKEMFYITAVTTLLGLFFVGTIKSKFSMRNWFVCGIETALIGGMAATIAYLVGYFIKNLVG
ncbi:MAG: VIT1/CCC1 transporter family protein [Candidatus Peregrinibacteria bacterium]|nr:VIT1/CCC1 transporter family protein [Candidatus Peregrinibacteria bacterium]